MAGQARRRAAELKRRARDAEQVRDRADRAVAESEDRSQGSPGGSKPKETRSNGAKRRRADTNVLAALPKQDLVDLARGLELEGGPSMTKPELVDVLESEGVSLEVLTKRELLTAGEHLGLEVRRTMTKQELVDTLHSPATSG
jgi:hypothetical protein